MRAGLCKIGAKRVKLRADGVDVSVGIVRCTTFYQSIQQNFVRCALFQPPGASYCSLFLSHHCRHLSQVSCQLHSLFPMFSVQSGFRNLDSRMRVYQCVCKSGCARAPMGGLFFFSASFLERVFIRTFKNVSETCQVVSAKHLQLLNTNSNFQIQPRNCAERRGEAAGRWGNAGMYFVCK